MHEELGHGLRLHGHLILLVRPRGLLLLIVALNSAERLALPLPSSA